MGSDSEWELAEIQAEERGLARRGYDQLRGVKIIDSPERQLEQAVPNAIRDLIELTQSADSERVQLDAIKALLMLAGVGKRDAEIEANDINGDEIRATIMRLLREKQESENSN